MGATRGRARGSGTYIILVKIDEQKLRAASPSSTERAMDPRYFSTFNRTRGVGVAARVLKADDYAARSRGLLGRESLAAGEGLWLVPCPMIHTFFMRFAIDALFLDRGLKVLRVLETLKPWRVSPWVWGAHSVLELAAGAVGGATRPGDVLEMRPL